MLEIIEEKLNIRLNRLVRIKNKNGIMLLNLIIL